MKNRNNIYTVTFVLLLISTLLMILMGAFSYMTLKKLLGSAKMKEKRLQERETVAEKMLKEEEEGSGTSVKKTVFDLNRKN